MYMIQICNICKTLGKIKFWTTKIIFKCLHVSLLCMHMYDVCGDAHMPEYAHGEQRTACRDDAPLPLLHGFQIFNSGHQICPASILPAKSSHWLT